MGSLRKIERSKLLVGEGIEETRFFNEFLKHLAVSEIQVFDYGGKSRLHDFLKALRTMSGYQMLEVLAITRDADDDSTRAFDSVCDGLRKAAFPVPEKRAEFARTAPSVGVFILPDCMSPGMLETACLQSVEHDGAIKCVDEYFRCVKKHASREPKNHWKARVHAWLASQVKPDKRLGEAAEAGYWQLDHDTFSNLAQFLRAM